jgi:hypothetical protein
MVGTRSDGEIGWKCLFGWVPHTETGNMCKTSRRPWKQENMCHGTCEDIQALILESGRGGQIDHRRIHVGTVKYGGFCLPGLVPGTKRGSHGQWELWNQNLVGQMDMWSDTCIMYGQWNLKEFASAGGSPEANM